jgi:hypothetical protein
VTLAEACEDWLAALPHRQKPLSMVAAIGELHAGLLTAVLRDQMRQGHVVRNVAEPVDRIPSDLFDTATWSLMRQARR